MSRYISTGNSSFDKLLGTYFGNDRQAQQGAAAGYNLINAVIPQTSYTHDEAAIAANPLVSYAQSMMDSAGKTSPLLQQQQQQLQGIYDRSLTQDPYVSEALSRMQAGLSGFSPEEMLAMREDASVGMGQGLQTGLRQAQQAGLAGNFSGSAINAQLPLAQFALAQRGLERDLAIKQIDERSRRLGEFANYSASAANDIFNRQSTAAGNAANFAYTNEQANRADQNNKFASLAGVYNQEATRQYEIGKYNNDSLLDYAQSLLSGAISGGSYSDTRKDTQTAFQITREANKNNKGSGGGGGMNINFQSAPNAPTGFPATNTNTGKNSALTV